jgi:hypothetical protein
MLEDVIYKGAVLELRTSGGHRVLIGRRGAAAPGEIYVRERRGRLYIEFRIFLRGSSFSKKIYLGRLAGIS